MKQTNLNYTICIGESGFLLITPFSCGYISRNLRAACEQKGHNKV